MRHNWLALPVMQRFVACALTLVSTLALAQDRSLEFGVKATYLYKFAAFVQWPPDAFVSPEAPLALCVLGTDAVTALTDEAVRGQQVAGRAVAVRHVASVDGETGCHVLYVASGRASVLHRTLERVRGTPVLTVSDNAPAGVEGLVINLVVVDGRVRFDIDLRAAAENRLVVSSKLLALAVNVRQSP